MIVRIASEEERLQGESAAGGDLVRGEELQRSVNSSWELQRHAVLSRELQRHAGLSRELQRHSGLSRELQRHAGRSIRDVQLFSDDVEG